MDVFIFRHGPAGGKAEKEAYADNDDARPLTKKGRAKTQEAAKGMAELGIKVDRILTSPLVRAEQTAKLAKKELKGKPQVLVEDALRPDRTPKATVERLIELLKDADPGGSVMLVGHEPHLSSLVSYMVTGSTYAGIDLGKAGLAQLEVERLATGKCAKLVRLLKAGDLTDLA